MLRTKLLLAISLPLVVLIGVGLYAVALFSELGGAIDVILRENYRSVVAAQKMKEAAERMDSAFLDALVGEEQLGRKLFDQHLPVFRENLNAELGNITLPGEGALAHGIEKTHADYARLAEGFWSAPAGGAERRALYFGELLPRFTRTKDDAQQILEMNQAHMLDADRKARALSDHSQRLMIAAILVALVVGIIAPWWLSRSMLASIQSLTESARAVGEGNLDQVVAISSHDELGQLAEVFNKMAGKLRAYRQATGDQILRAQLTTQATLAAFPDPVFVMTPSDEVEFKNPAAERLLESRLGPELMAASDEQLRRVLRGEGDYLPVTFEKAICVRVDDQEKFLLPRILGMRNPDGAIFGAAVVLQDVTRFRLMDDFKTNLVSTVSHELKTPLTSVRMALHLLLEEQVGALTPKQAELVIAARDDAERLLRILNDLLDLARMEGGRPRLNLQPVPAERLVTEAVSRTRELVQAQGVGITGKAAPDLPSVLVDQERISHVFLNLISNAAKHSPRGSEIVVSAEPRDDGAVCFSVTDRGEGIPEEYQPRVFEKFFRVPGGDKTGAGLGLAIAREIVTAMGGTIGVKSAPGEGSRFHFVLPAEPQPEQRI